MPHLYSADHPLHAQSLKDKQRRLRDGFAPPLTLRVHRALSWLLRAEQETDDEDVRFILLWIGFNAAYAGDISQASGEDGRTERERFLEFFHTMVRFDSTHRLYDACWDRFTSEIRLLLNNRYVYAAFWLHQNGYAGYSNWDLRLADEWRQISKALAAHDTATLLSKLFDRLYVLRNQLVHGGGTWNSSVNREQVEGCSALLGCLLPIFIDLMMDNPGHDWSMPHYPVVD
ncbi:HEPN domain-containing protein [Novosphingobium decolorationis]|uniref:Apea-like HEPN domain-containing protein n=1 Tax=Novosphingobium decolorationis TaxID=2698673 RepID=A0ABX8E849_9SPHN|nr:HEPN domain-containing protein [Novosphingobium decolorationis]QVM85177.1 hypothetical protein HT578_17070 [Novosphingobium decolorationis]